jgi:hypothetical protein
LVIGQRLDDTDEIALQRLTMRTLGFAFQIALKWTRLLRGCLKTSFFKIKHLYILELTWGRFFGLPQIRNSVQPIG